MSSAKIAISCSGPSSTRPAATNRPANGPFWSSVTTCSTRGPGPSSPPPSRARPPGPASPSGSDRHSAPEAFMGEDRTDPNPLHRAARSPRRARPPGGSRSGDRRSPRNRWPLTNEARPIRISSDPLHRHSFCLSSSLTSSPSDPILSVRRDFQAKPQSSPFASYTDISSAHPPHPSTRLL